MSTERDIFFPASRLDTLNERLCSQFAVYAGGKLQPAAFQTKLRTEP